MPLEEKVKDLSDSIDTVAKDMEDLVKRVEAIENTYLTEDALDTNAPSTRDLLLIINELQEHIARKEGGAPGVMFTMKP